MGIKIDEATRERCAEVVWQIYGQSNFHPDDNAKDAWNQCCEAAVKAIRALPAAPVRPLPTVEDVAKAICCPKGGCGFQNWYVPECSFEVFADQAATVLALFTGDAK